MIIFWQLAIMAFSALLSYALAPKPKPAEKVKANIPVVEDGKGVEHLFGCCWFEDEVFLGFKEMGTTKIRQQGGKK